MSQIFALPRWAHHVTRDRVQKNLSQIPNRSAAGVDGQTVEAAKESFEEWIEPMLQSIHRQGYRAPDIRRVYIPKPGKTEKRPLGVPTVSDRALQRSTAEVLSAIYEQDFLPCSFGGRPKLSAHHALATLNEVIAGGMISWVLEADLKNFFGSLSHDWVLRFVEHRVGDPRLISLIRRWLKAGLGRRSGPSERTGNATGWVDQRPFEQSLPSLRAGPLV